MFDAVTFDHTGDAGVLRAVRLTPEPIGPRDVRIRQRWAGVNFIDVYHRTGLYPVPSLPAIPGVEAAGVVEAIGRDVDGLEVGQSVAWAGLPMGGYAQSRVIAAERVIALPEHVSERVAAGAMLRDLPRTCSCIACGLSAAVTVCSFMRPPAVSGSSSPNGRSDSTRRSSALWEARKSAGGSRGRR